MLLESQRTLILHSEFTALVFGKGESFVLLKCNGDDASDVEDARAAGQRGMTFCGVLALQDGQLKADIDPTNTGAVYTMMFALLAFVHLVADRFKSQAQPKGDAVEWLTRLFTLDTRTDA